jgi:NitT/TauT family transport system substrate-binding protein
MSKFKSLALAALMVVSSLLSTPAAEAQAPKQKPHCKLAVSIYAEWMPWYYANEEGIIKKWADRYGVDIEVQYMAYAASLDAFVAGKADACVMTNMECLDMPAASGVDSTAIIMGDYSNGNDAILVRNKLTLPKLSGKQIYLVEKTVSQYLLTRALETAGLDESNVTLVNVADENTIAPSFLASKSQQAVVTWNPIVMQIEQTRGVTRIFDSSKIPGEIQDLCVVNTKVLNASPDFARALTGAWYEVMGVMTERGNVSDAAIAKMAKLSSCTPTEFTAQLRTTAMFYTPQSATEFTKSDELKEKQNLVRKFCFAHGLLGDNAKSVDVVGIQYPDGTVVGNPKNIKMRYSAVYMEEAAAGKISIK